jgi:predicted ArsR family transcriptional regulator
MSEGTTGRDADVLALLAEPVRRRLYEHVIAARAAVDRDSAAEAVGIGRPLAAFHLDRLAEAGLLAVEFHRRSGRSGPGAGRPAKFYRAAARDGVEVSVPPRRYAVPARLFAEALEESPTPGAIGALHEAAARRGRALAEAGRGQAADDGRRPDRQTLVDVLLREGFEPEEDGAAIRLRNCPFDGLVDAHRQLTCGANLAALRALGEGIPEAGLSAEPDALPGECCVRFRPTAD